MQFDAVTMGRNTARTTRVRRPITDEAKRGAIRCANQYRSGSERVCRLLARKVNYGPIVTLFAAAWEVDEIIYCEDNDEFVQIGGSC